MKQNFNNKLKKNKEVNNQRREENTNQNLTLGGQVKVADEGGADRRNLKQDPTAGCEAEEQQKAGSGVWSNAGSGVFDTRVADLLACK